MKRVAKHRGRLEVLILFLREERVLLDADLAEIYGVSTKALNQAVKRNAERFPNDFMFQLSDVEKQEVVTNCDHLSRLKYSKARPYAFTEHGALMVANVLSSEEAVKMGLYVVRAFIKQRKLLTMQSDILKSWPRWMRSSCGMMRLFALFGRSFNRYLFLLLFRRSDGLDLGKELLTPR